MAGLMIQVKPGKGAPKDEPESESDDDAGTFGDAFSSLCEAMGWKPKDEAEAAAAFRACCMTCDE